MNTEILQLKSKIAGLEREINVLKYRGNNSVNLIRSNLNLLNLSDDEDVSDLDIDSCKVEMDELVKTVEVIKKKKEQLNKLRRELSKITDAVG